MKALSKRSSSCARSVASNSSSVSSQNPTSRSVVMAMSGMAARSAAYQRPERRRSRIRGACGPAPRRTPLCSGRWTCLQILGVSAIAAMTSSAKVERVGRVKRTRSMPSTAATARSSCANPDVLAAVRVHRLAEQLHLLDARRHQRAHLAQDLARRASRARARACRGRRRRCRTCRSRAGW